MKNTILKFDERTGTVNGTEYTVPDYFSKDINVKEFFDNLPNAQNYYAPEILEQNEKLERLQHEKYQNQAYWDIIQLVNGIDPLVSMPVSDELINQEFERLIQKILQGFYRTENISEERIREELKEAMNEEANKKRYAKIITPSRIQEFIEVLKQNGFVK